MDLSAEAASRTDDGSLVMELQKRRAAALERIEEISQHRERADHDYSRTVEELDLAAQEQQLVVKRCNRALDADQPEAPPMAAGISAATQAAFR